MIESPDDVFIPVAHQPIKHPIPGLSRKRTMLSDGLGIGQHTLAETIERQLAQFLELLPVAFDDGHEHYPCEGSLTK
ncbi:hypothetical protein D3C76_1079730 [compost metagenome]